MKVTILGCGPSGLLAAHAFSSEGWDVTILSKKKPSVIGGAQYLHRAIPGVTSHEPEGICEYMKIGTRDEYALKVYGSIHADVSWDLYAPGPVGIWSLRRIYNRLWDKYEPLIMGTELDAHMVKQLARDNFVVSTIPATLLCEGRCTFHSQRVYIFQKPVHEASIPEHFILYNGSSQHPQYRQSRIFGVESWEYAVPSAAEYEGVIKVNKPISTDCQCLPGVMRLGRYGRWDKAQLAHLAFEQAQEVARAV